MKKDNSVNNFNYAGLSIDKIINNPDEYIVPECLEACKKFWNMNIFTASCSNRREYKDKYGNIKKYIMVSHLSDENRKIFEDLIESNPNNYVKKTIADVEYYAIYILSKDNIQDRDLESQKLLDLVSPFKMQDCLEGFISIKDYYLKKILDYLYSTEDISISVPESELIDAVKRNLGALGNLDLLDIDRGIIYKNRFYRDAHLKYLKMQQKDSQDLQEHE